MKRPHWYKKRPLGYVSWNQMKSRCYNKNHPAYHHYGGRGIKVCKRWLDDFNNFLEDMGTRPSSKHSLDRYPNLNGNYEPDNCRWATVKQQMGNRRNCSWISFKGRKMIISDWAAEFGTNACNLRRMMNRRGTFEYCYNFYKKNLKK
jgi:hypothetical protein